MGETCFAGFSCRESWCGGVRRSLITVTPSMGWLAAQGVSDGAYFCTAAMAAATLHSSATAIHARTERGLDPVGFMAFLDPPKESAAETIRALHRHGVQVKIITGYHDIIARQVCNQVGIDLQQVLTGPELVAMDTATLNQVVTKSQLFARLNPQQKVRVIEVLRAQGHIVAGLGDGIVVYLALVQIAKPWLVRHYSPT